jgi:hypothetical protein
MPKNAIPDSVKRAVAINTSSAMFLHVSSFMSDYGDSRYTILLHVPFQTCNDIPHPINGTCSANRTVNPAYGTSSETRTPGARRRSSYSICTNPAPRVSSVEPRLLNPACTVSLGLLGTSCRCPSHSSRPTASVPMTLTNRPSLQGEELLPAYELPVLLQALFTFSQWSGCVYECRPTQLLLCSIPPRG